MNITGTGFQVWPLTTGNNDDPSLSPGKPTSFNCNTVPDRQPSGPLANYLPGIIVTFSGEVVQAGSTGDDIPIDRFYGALVESFDWIQCWHGNQISANYVKGAHWTPIEYNAMGFRHPLRQQGLIAPAANGTYPFEVSMFVPACSGFGRLFLETMQLAILFRNSQLKINVAPSSTLSTMSPGATMTGPSGEGTVTARASAVLVPRQDLVLAPAIEWVLSQIVAGTSSPQVQIKGFGTDSQMQGVEPGGGVITLMELTDTLDQGGVFIGTNVTQYQFPWRGQQVTQHMQAMIAQIITGMPNDRPRTFPAAVAGNTDFAGYPYTVDNPGTASPTQDLNNLLGWIMAQGADDLELTQLQTADSDQSYFLTVNGGFDPGSHQVLGQFARSWQASMVNNWRGQVLAGDDSSLARYVLGPNYKAAKLHRRTPRSQHVITDDQVRYLPWQLV